MTLEPGIPLDIQFSPLGKPVLAAIQFNIQARFEAEEIQDMISKGLLPPELVG